jgi:hypothetical protein
LREIRVEVPVQVVLKKMPQAEVVREDVIKAADVLARFHPRVTSCRVSVTNPGMRHRQGALFDVHVVLQVPGCGEVGVSRCAAGQPEREHLNVALRRSFAQARRQLQDAVRELRSDVKARAPRDARKVRKLFGYVESEADKGPQASTIVPGVATRPERRR